MSVLGRRKGVSGAGALAIVVAGLSLAPSAAAASPPLGLTDCGAEQRVYVCSGLVETWDGVPLDTTVVLPEKGAANLPLVAEIHGFGNSKYEYLDPTSTAYTDNAFAWARAGYAVLTYTARGLWGSCGTPEARTANPGACASGYIHLADVRYEVRDAQELIGRLVDDGVAKADAIGATGDSYGGGQTFMLAALRDRTMLPDGRLVPWRSPAGRRLSLAAAAPVIPWTDLVYAAAPNGRSLTYTITPRASTGSPVGVAKASVQTAILASAQNSTGPGQPVGEPFVPGRPMGYLAPPGINPEADVAGWVGRTMAGEPYDDSSTRSIVSLLERYHSAYQLASRVEPPPMLIASGFTDDLFPVDEALRFVSRTEARHPDAELAVLLGDFGHQRSSNKPDVRRLLLDSIHQWFDRHLRGRGPMLEGVTALTQTCPRDAASGGPFKAPTFARLARGEVRFRSPDARSILSVGGDPVTAAKIDPVTGGGNACVTIPGDNATEAALATGTTSYDLPPAEGRGYTLLGAPTVIAGLAATGVGAAETMQVASRLWDVAPDGSRTLVARGLYRPRPGSDRQVWQLHPNGWRFAAGHHPQLELHGADPPYGRPSNQPFTIAVENLELRLPVRESRGKGISPPAEPVVPRGERLVG